MILKVYVSFFNRAEFGCQILRTICKKETTDMQLRLIVNAPKNVIVTLILILLVAVHNVHINLLNMPKRKQSKSARLAGYVKKFPAFKTDGSILMCKICNKSVSSEKIFFLQAHIKSAGHLSAEQKASNTVQQLLSDNILSKQAQFAKDLCQAFVAADIPLHKLRNKNLTDFLQKHIGQTVPSETSVRSNIKDLYENALNDIKMCIKNRYVWISLDETTDNSGRHIVLVVLGILDTDIDLAKKIYLIHVENVDKVNHTTVARTFDNAVRILGEDFNKDTILLYLSDAAPYMVKSARALQVFYPKLMHVTCLAHGLHRVCEAIRDSHPKVNEVVASVKKIFVKAPARIDIFKENEPDIPLPPEPVITRWGTWLEAVKYYAKYFENINKILDLLDTNDSKYIQIAKDLFADKSVREDIIYIASNFGTLTNSIKTLESSTQLLTAQISVVLEAKKTVDDSQSSKVKDKFNSILQKNQGFMELRNIAGQFTRSNPLMVHNVYTVSETLAFKFAPITSVEVERTFSMFKSVYRDNRNSFLFENLAHLFIVYCNSNFNLK